MSFTLDVIKLFKSIDNIDLQEENIPYISSTLEVSKLLKSNKGNFQQLWNILCIFLTDEVLKFPKLTEISELQP